MNRLRYSGTVKSAELCTFLEGVRVRRTGADGKMREETSSDRYGNWSLEDFYTGDEVSFTARGFVTKTYQTRKIPEVVRLLEDRLVGYQKLDRLLQRTKNDRWTFSGVNQTTKCILPFCLQYSRKQNCSRS